MKINHEWSPNMQTLPSVSKTWRRLWGFTSTIILLSGVHGVFDATYASKKTGTRILSALKCVWDLQYGRSRKSKSRCGSSKAKRCVKITSRFRHGGLWLVRFVLQSSSIYSPFFLARFGVHEHWNEYVCVKRLCVLVLVIYSPDMFTCTPHVYMRLELYVQRHRESFRSAYGLLGRFFVVLLTCCFACHVYCRPKKLWNMKAIKWKCAKLLTSCTCADNFTGRLFLIAFNNMMFILTFRVLFAICFVSKRFCVSCEPYKFICMSGFLWAYGILFLLRVHAHFSVHGAMGWRGSSLHQMIPMKIAQLTHVPLKVPFFIIFRGVCFSLFLKRSILAQRQSCFWIICFKIYQSRLE